jgi:asparagine synthase (glutamine-hydrolysing)
MCGIAGELRFDDRPADAAALGRMAAAMAPRGPDGSGLWARDGRGLAHRRLRIIDLSERGAQPMSDPELGLTIAFNGCIYNYRALREELARSGYRFASDSDTEVLIKAYHRWGVDFLQRLHGMFAFAIVEHASGRAVLARDRLGVKPLYFSEHPAALRFASTLPALLAGGGIDTTIDSVALHHYLSWHAVVPPPRTILSGVSKLAPATVLTVEPDGSRTHARYWQPKHERPALERSSEEWVADTRETLRTAVRRRMVADVPVGVLLSGGLDSSLIASLLAREGTTALKTFAVGFPAVGEHRGDEFEFSDLVARELGTEHHRIEVPTARVLDALPAAVAAMSEPMVSHDAVAFYVLAEEVSRSITVVQSGQGADEVFAGYHWYPRMAEVANADPRQQLDAYEAAFFDRSHAEINAVVAPPHRLEEPVSRMFVAEHFAAPGAATAIDRALRLDQEVMLAEDPVKRVDNMTMAHGLEARVPFLDHELVELAASCPPELKLEQGGKGTLKSLARGLVPDAVIDRRKGYFPVPALVELGGPILEMINDTMRSSRARERELWDRAHVDALLAAPNASMTPSGANQLWQLALLETWLQSHGI